MPEPPDGEEAVPPLFHQELTHEYGGEFTQAWTPTPPPPTSDGEDTQAWAPTPDEPTQPVPGAYWTPPPTVDPPIRSWAPPTVGAETRSGTTASFDWTTPPVVPRPDPGLSEPTGGHRDIGPMLRPSATESKLTKVAHCFAIARDLVLILLIVAALWVGGRAWAGYRQGATPTPAVVPGPVPAVSLAPESPCPSYAVDQWGTYCPLAPGE